MIDDDVFVLEALALGLRDCGYEVRTATGAAAGLDLILRGGVDAVVTDLNMPGAGGAQLIAEVRARWLHLPIIAISGAHDSACSDLADAAHVLGADTMLIKPFRARELDEALQHAMRVRRTSHRAR
ncbi:MAG: response regulator [Vitreimonas sp.]